VVAACRYNRETEHTAVIARKSPAEGVEELLFGEMDDGRELAMDESGSKRHGVL